VVLLIYVYMFLNTQVDATLDIELDNDELGAELEKYFYKKKLASIALMKVGNSE
jgi:hypothetical protein